MIFDESLVVFSYARCSTCRKALNWLDQRNIEYELKDIVENPPDLKQLSSAIDFLESRKLLFNTSGLSYRSIGADKIKSMSDKEVLKLLALDGKLIKRPFVSSKDSNKILVGFKLDVWDSLYAS